jgi:hypothetical protein
MWFRRRIADARSVTYGPMAERDRQRINNLRYIYEPDLELIYLSCHPFKHARHPCPCFPTLGWMSLMLAWLA